MIWLNLFLILVLLILDAKLTRMVFSANQFLLLSILVIYVLPGFENHYENVDGSVFFFLLFYVISRLLVKKQINAPLNETDCFNITSLLWFTLFFNLIYLLSSVNYEFDLFFQRVINPRAFTYLTEGEGPFTVTLGIFTLLVSFYAIRNFLINNNSFSQLFLAILNISLNASKSTYIVLFIQFILIYQIYNKLNWKKLVAIPIATVILGYVSFSLYGQASDKNFDLDVVSQRVVDYFKEYKNTSLVLNDYTSDLGYLKDALYQTAIAPVPRLLWPDKPHVSFYNSYWQKKYEPNVPIFQSSTYGFLSEAHMVLGFIGPLFYAIFFAYYVRMADKLYVSRSAADNFMAIYLIILLFFFIRGGIFFTTPWQVLIAFVISNFMQKFILKKY